MVTLQERAKNLAMIGLSVSFLGFALLKGISTKMYDLFWTDKKDEL
jgi:hypothetical protein